MQTSLTGSPSGLANLGIAKFLTAGGAAGILAAAANVTYNLVREGVTDKTFDELSPASIIFTSLFTAIVGAMFYWILSRRTARATVIFQGVGAVFTLLSCVPNIVNESEFGEGFATASIPLHLIAGIVAIIVIPFVVKRQANH